MSFRDLLDISPRRELAKKRRRESTKLTPRQGTFDLPDGTMKQIATLAAIPDPDKPKVFVPDEFPGDGSSFWITTRDAFDLNIMDAVRSAWLALKINSPNKVASHRKIVRAARDLVECLKVDGEHLSFFLLHGETISDHIVTIEGLAQEAQLIGRRSKVKRRPRWSLRRKRFVEELLDASVAAGGKLTLDRRTMRHSERVSSSIAARLNDMLVMG
jgi:hypothetical protein